MRVAHESCLEMNTYLLNPVGVAAATSIRDAPLVSVMQFIEMTGRDSKGGGTPRFSCRGGGLADLQRRILTFGAQKGRG